MIEGRQFSERMYSHVFNIGVIMLMGADGLYFHFETFIIWDLAKSLMW